jgi:hypothetical protein
MIKIKKGNPVYDEVQVAEFDDYADLQRRIWL